MRISDWSSDVCSSDLRLLDELMTLSSEIEDVAAATTYRFSAARAYYALVLRRVEELREQRVEGLQTVSEFVDRRLAPAMRTCEAVAERLETLSRRVARASQLLRDRAEIQLEGKNREGGDNDGIQSRTGIPYVVVM